MITQDDLEPAADNNILRNKTVSISYLQDLDVFWISQTSAPNVSCVVREKEDAETLGRTAISQGARKLSLRILLTYPRSEYKGNSNVS